MIQAPAAVDDRGRFIDVLCAVAAGALTFAVYLRTLAPGLVAIFDTPMFQFIGRVLGVPHNPGYPLYVGVTWAFSHLPIGTLPYRINLFSAVCGALTVSLVVLLARELGCRRVIAVAAALGLAFGPVFWSQSVIAEVYTLDAAIVAAMLLAMLIWGRTRRPAWFYTAVALLAAGLGHHTTILGFAPGMAVYALAIDRRFALRARTLAAAAAIVGLGLLQYLFVLVRSQQPGVYAESHATTLTELLRVMSGAQFRGDLFTFDLRTVVTGQLPMVVTRILVPELTIVGCALAMLGLAWLLRRRLAAAILLLSGAAAIVGFALNYAVVDLPVFLIPAALVGWVLAGVGAERVAAAAGQRLRPAAGPAIAVSTLFLAGSQLTANFAASDRSRDTGDAVRLDRLFDALPDRTAIVHEDFLVDRMVAFELFGRRAAAGREIVQVAADAGEIERLHERGFTVVGFPKAVDRLRQDALDFGFAPIPVTERSLHDLLWRLPEGTTVALAVPAAYSAAFAEAAGDALSLVGGPDELRSRAASALVIIGARGTRTGSIVRAERRNLHEAIAAGDPVGQTSRIASASFEIDVGMDTAVIRQDGREIVRTTRGPALVCWLPDGQRMRDVVLEAADGFQVPIPPGPLSVYRLLGRWERRPISGGTWTDLRTSGQTGSVMLEVPAGGSVVVYAADDGSLAPRVFERWPEATAVDIRTFGPDDAIPDNVVGLRAPGSLANGGHVTRIQVSAPGRERAVVVLALGGVASRAVGRVVRGEAEGAAAFRVDTHDLLRRPDSSTRTLLLANDDQTLLAGAGWSAVDHDAVSAYRWMTDVEARLLLPIVGPPPRRILLQALRDPSGGPSTIALSVNGVPLPALPLDAGWHVYEWTAPDGLFRSGTNDVTLMVDRLPENAGRRGRAIAVSDVRLRWDGVE